MQKISNYIPSGGLPDKGSMSGDPSSSILRPARGPSLAWCYTLLAPAMIFMLTALDRGYQTDLWHHLARGREIWQDRAILNEDVFTYTVAGQPIVDNNWLTQVIAYKLYQIGGLDLVQTANSILLGLTVSVIVSIGLRRGASARVAGWIGVLLVAGLSPTLLIRPQTVSMLLFALMLLVLIEADRKPKLLYLAPLLMAVWANVHGAFPIGLMLVGCFTFAACVDRLRKRPTGQRAGAMIGCLMECFAATLINPYGWRVYGYVLNTSSRASSRVIQEWLRPNITTAQGGFWLASIVAMIALAFVVRKQLRLWMVVVLAVFGAISSTSVRMSIWWYLTAAVIAMSIWPRRETQPAKPSRLAGVLYAVMILAMFLSLPAMQRWNPIFLLRPSTRPEDDLAKLTDAIVQASPNARVFSKLEWGEYLSFQLPWRNAVFMDGRIEIYPDELWDEYRQITSSDPGWQDKLDQNGVDVLLLDRFYHDGLILAVSKSPHWKQLSEAGSGVIFLRNGE